MRENFPEIDFGLYRDDGLGVHENIPGPRLAKLRKNIEAFFKDLGLKITIETAATVVNFLDITLNLTLKTIHPYQKPNDTTVYINTESNHPPNVIKQVPISVNSRLTHISSSEEIFNNAKRPYEESLKKVGIKQTSNTHQTKKKSQGKTAAVILHGSIPHLIKM